MATQIGNFRANLPILTGKSNYRRWYNSCFVILRRAKYWSVVSDGNDKENRPSAPLKDETPENFEKRRALYDERNDAAHTALLSGVSEELQELVGSCAIEQESARAAMRKLKAKFDHETTTLTLNLFKSFLELKMDEGDSIADHISSYETSFGHLGARCSESKWPEAIALRSFLSVEGVNIMCLFLSLPASYEKIIDNLSTKEKLQYTDVNNRLLDLSTKKSSKMSSATSKAYSTSELKSQKGGKREYTWCKKHGGRYQGHYHTEYRKLKAHLENNPLSKGKGKERTSTMKNEKAYKVTETSSPDETSDITFAEYKAFSAILSQPSPSH
ncbi:hypothetical protein K3495_g11758 [Podosphaera aphanis]|nr:hypothetical protein K3495_g11758 [Podosphaera aphanis]